MGLIYSPTNIIINGTTINNVSYINQSSTPVTRIDGSSLVTGDRFYNSSNGKTYFWNGVYWQNINTRTIGHHVSSFAVATATFTQGVNVSVNHILLSASCNRIQFSGTSTNNGNLDLELMNGSNGIDQTVSLFNTFTDASTVGITRAFSSVLNTATAGAGNPFLRIKLNNATGTSAAASGQFAISYTIAEIL